MLEHCSWKGIINSWCRSFYFGMLLIIMIFLKSSIIEMLSMHSQDTDIFRQKRCWVRKCNACSHMRTAGNQAASYDFHFQELHEGFLSRLSYFSEQNYRNGIKLLCTRLFCSYMWVIFDNLIKRMWTLFMENHIILFLIIYIINTAWYICSLIVKLDILNKIQIHCTLAW